MVVAGVVVPAFELIHRDDDSLPYAADDPASLLLTRLSSSSPHLHYFRQMMIPLIFPYLHSEDEAVAVAVEAAWRALSFVVAAAEAAGAETGVVRVFVETILLSLRFLVHLYCLRLGLGLELKLSLQLNEVVVEAEAAPARY
jgi:hypothetical protein